MRKKDKAEQKNTIDSLPRRNFLRGMTGFAGVGVVAMMSGIGCASISAPTPIQKEPEITSEKHRDITICGGDEDEREKIKDTVDFMYDMHETLSKVGINYREGSDKLTAFAKTDTPIIINKDLKGPAAFFYNPITKDTELEIHKYIVYDDVPSLSKCFHHEMVHFDQRKIKDLVYSSSKYTESEIKRLNMEEEICAHTSDSEYFALAYMAEKISNGKTTSNDARQIATESIEELSKTYLEHAEDINNYSTRKNDATIAVLRTIAEKGPEAVASMETKVAAYNVIRGHVKGELSPNANPQALYEKYALQNYKSWLFYKRDSQKVAKDNAPHTPMDNIIESLHERDTRGNITEKGIAYPILSEENKQMFDKVANAFKTSALKIIQTKQANSQ